MGSVLEVIKGDQAYFPPQRDERSDFVAAFSWKIHLSTEASRRETRECRDSGAQQPVKQSTALHVCHFDSFLFLLVCLSGCVALCVLCRAVFLAAEQ